MTPEQQGVVDVNRERIAALVAGDLDALSSHVGEDLVYVSAAGTVHTRAEVFAAFRSGALRVEQQAARDVDVRIHGEVAIAGYLVDSVTLDHGNRIEATTRCTSVYVHRAGRWQLVLQHNTYVA